MFVKNELWDFDPVLPCFKREGANMIVYHPLIEKGDVYQLSGNYIGTANAAALKIRARTEDEKRYAVTRQFPCERAINIACLPDKIAKIMKEKKTRIFGQDEAGNWSVREELNEDPATKKTIKTVYDKTGDIIAVEEV